MYLELIKDEKAAELLADDQFCKKWDALHEACPWATVFQSSLFARIWYQHYKEDYSLIFLTEKQEAGELTGLLCLAQEKGSGKLHHVGTYHAEYQSWLAKPENGNTFIADALKTLKENFPKNRITFLFLSPNSPLGWLSAKEHGAYCALQDHVLPLIDLSKTEKFTESLKKRGNKNKLNRIKKLGEVKMEWVEGLDEFENVFDEIEHFSKLRTSALHNVAPELCPKRKAFHRALMSNGLISTSLFKAGERLASAQIIFKNGEMPFLSTIAMSPFMAAFSPSVFHLMYLSLELSEKGVRTFDLSPGEGYKERFATHTEKIHSLDIFFDKKAFLLHRAQTKTRKAIKLAFERMNITKSGAYAYLDRVLHTMDTFEYGKVPQKLIGKIKKKVYESLELRVYAYEVAKIKDLPQPEMIRRDNILDLLKYRSVSSEQFTRNEFHKEVLSRFEQGVHSYTYADGEKLLHCGWLREREEEAELPDVGQTFKLPPDSAVLFDYYTHPEARGQGLYKNSLLQGLHDAATIPGTKKVFIAVLANNTSSRRVIEKAGFEYKGSLFKKKFLGKVTKWQEWDSSFLADIPKSSDSPNEKPQVPAGLLQNRIAVNDSQEGRT